MIDRALTYMVNPVGGHPLAAALDTIALLDRELSMMLAHADVLSAHNYGDARNLWELRRSQERAVTWIRGLREELLMLAGDESEQYLEVAIRERTAAIVARLGELVLADVEPPPGPPLFTGRFERFADVNTHLLDRVGRLTESCTRARLNLQTVAFAEAEQLQQLYRGALRSSFETFASIGAERDVATFLRTGAAEASEPVRIACRALASLLEVSLSTAEAS
jgi:hypothetical protein